MAAHRLWQWTPDSDVLFTPGLADCCTRPGRCTHDRISTRANRSPGPTPGRERSLRRPDRPAAPQPGRRRASAWGRRPRAASRARSDRPARAARPTALQRRAALALGRANVRRPSGATYAVQTASACLAAASRNVRCAIAGCHVPLSSCQSGRRAVSSPSSRTSGPGRVASACRTVRARRATLQAHT